MMIPRWLVMLIALALSCAVLEGLLDSAPAWFVQVSGLLTLACPILLIARSFRPARTLR